jgi:hypothetical protein
MRLRLLTVVGALALALAVPSAALAHGRGHHRHHGAKAHHARFRFEHIGATGVSGPTTTPSAPTSSPTTPGPVNAGEVASYDTTNMLVLTLNNKESVSGKVTSDTKIECVTEAATPTAPTGSEPTDQSPGDDSGQGDDQSRGDVSQQGDEPGQSSGDDGQDSSDDDGSAGAGPAASEPPCDSTLLKPGTKVRSAELRIGPSGTEFEDIVLVR